MCLVYKFNYYLCFFVFQHTFRFPTSIIAVSFHDVDGKRRIITATKDGNIFAMLLPANLTKAKRYAMNMCMWAWWEEGGHYVTLL